MSARLTSSSGTPDIRVRISRSFPGFVVATSSCRIRVRRTERPPLLSEDGADVAALQSDQLANARIPEIKEAVERLASERHRFRGSLQLDVQSGARLYDVHIDVGLRVLDVREVQHWHPFDDADARARNVVLDRHGP